MKRFVLRAARPISNVVTAAALCLAIAAGAGLTAAPGCDDAGSKPAAKAAAPPPDRLAALATTRPASAGPYTWHDYYRESLELNRATLGDAYRTAGTRGPWDAAAEQFFERVALHMAAGVVEFAYHPDKFPLQEELIAEAKALIDQGCTDPLLAYVHASVTHDSGNPVTAAPLLRQAAEGMLKSGYPTYRKFVAAQRAGLLVHTSNYAGPADQAARSAAWTSERELATNLRTNIERRRVLDILHEHYEETLHPDSYVGVATNMQGQRGVDPWVLDTLIGKAHLENAWKIRGFGWAHTVSDQKWRGFLEQLGRARTHLTRAWRLRPELPEAPTAMISVAIGAGGQLGEDPMTWFERAEAAQLDYTPAYDAMLDAALLPRWGGSHRAMYEFGLRAAKTGRYDTLVPYQLYEAVLAIAGDIGGSWDVLSWPGAYSALGAMFDGYERRPDRPYFGLARHRSRRAAIAWRARRYEEAKRLLDQLGDDVYRRAFTQCKAASAGAAIGQVYAMTGKDAERVAQAEALLAAGDPARALAAFRAAAKSPAAAADPRVQAYFDARIELLDQRVRLGKNQWVALRTAEGLPGWERQAGRWEHVGEGGGIRGTRGKRMETSAILMCQEDVGARYEFAAHVRRDGDSQVAVMLESPGRDYVFVVFGPRGTMVRYPNGSVHPLVAGSAPAAFDVACVFERGTINVRLGEQLVARNIGLGPEFAGPGGRVGISVTGEGSAEFSNLRLRRLAPAGPPPGVR